MTSTPGVATIAAELQGHFQEAALRARLRAGGAPTSEVLALIGRLEEMVRHSNSEVGAWVELMPALTRVREAIDRNDPPELSIIGPFKAGKSSVLNALLGEDVAPVDVKPTTLKPTFYRQGSRKRVRFREQGVWRPESWDQFRELVHGGASNLSPEELDLVEAIEVVHPGVPDELVLVDTPGFHSGNADDDAAALAQADATAAYVWVMDINKGQLAEHDVEILVKLRQDGRPCFAVLNKADGKSPSDRLKTLEVFKRAHGARFDEVFLFSATSRRKRDQGAAFKDGHLEHIVLDWDTRVVPKVTAASEGLRARAALREVRAALEQVLGVADDDHAQADACVEAGITVWQQLTRVVQDVINRSGSRLSNVFEKESKRMFAEASRALRAGVVVVEESLFAEDKRDISGSALEHALNEIETRTERLQEQLVALTGEAVAEVRAHYESKVESLSSEMPLFGELTGESDSFVLAQESMEEMFAYGPAIALHLSAAAVAQTLWTYGGCGVANSIFRSPESGTTQLVDEAVSDELIGARMQYLLYGESATTGQLTGNNEEGPRSVAERLLWLTIAPLFRLTGRLGNAMDVVESETEQFRSAIAAVDAVDKAIRGLMK